MDGTHLLYYPGCTLRTTAKNFDESSRAVMAFLGVELDELPGWVCCGAVPPLLTDDVMKLVAPVRNLANAGKRGNTLVTGCAFCYNILKRSNKIVRDDVEKRDTINNFIEERYKGNVKVLHLLEVLRDVIGFEAVKKKVRMRLKGLTVAPYYGCLLLRPYEAMGLDNPEDPRILEDLVRNLGGKVIDFPHKTECCGSYLGVSSQDVAVERARVILSSAVRNGAETIVVSCPLCHFNLDHSQGALKERQSGFREVPILYFTQLVGVALGIGERCGLDQHYVAPRPLLNAKEFIGQAVVH